jgi:8-oxo-dGTP diphosphatase
MKISLAACVITDDYGNLLLVHRDRGDESNWELPGGKVGNGELPEVAAVREVREALGIGVRLTKLLGNGEFSHDGDDYSYHWFKAEIAAGEPVLVEPEIFDDYSYFELDDLPTLALSANMQVLLPKLADGEVALD